MSDANTQSVEKCKFRHDWVMKDRIRCALCDALPKSKEQAAAEAVVSLKDDLKPGDTVYTKVDSVSRSGMSRVISCYIIRDNEPRWISYLVSKATGLGFDEKREGVKIGGCGMNMGFAIVYELSHVLFPHGFECIGDRCPANDHFNGDRNYKPHFHSNAGGYALRQRWL